MLSNNKTNNYNDGLDEKLKLGAHSPKNSSTVISFGVDSFNSIIDSGADITVVRPEHVSHCNSDLSESSCKIKLSSAFGDEAEAFLVNARCRIIDGKGNYRYTSILIAVTDKLVGPALLSVNDYRVIWNSTVSDLHS